MDDYNASNYFTSVAFPSLQLEKFLAGSPDEYAFEDAELINATHVIVFDDHTRHVKLVMGTIGESIFLATENKIALRFCETQ
jgi:hypothetical protein